MKKLQILFLFTYFWASQSLALSCQAPTLNLDHTKNIYPDSIFWLQSPNFPKNFFLSSAIDQSKLISIKDKFKALPNEYSFTPTFSKLKPQKELKADQKYFLSNPKLSANYINKSYAYTIKAKSPIPDLKWISFPKLSNVNYVDNNRSSLGRRGHIRFTFKANLSADDFLLRVQQTSDPSWKSATTHIINPINEENHMSAFSLGFGDCEGKSFNFNPNETIYIKIDLISHDGKIVPWQGNALKFELIKKFGDKCAPYKPVSDKSLSVIPKRQIPSYCS